MKKFKQTIEEAIEQMVMRYILEHKEKKLFNLQEALDLGLVPHLKGAKVYSGKTSDCVSENADGKKLYNKDGNEVILMVRSSRISTHDIGRGTIPFKDQIQSLINNLMHGIIRHLADYSLIELYTVKPGSPVSLHHNLDQFLIEAVLRTHLPKANTSTSMYKNVIELQKTTFSGIDFRPYLENLVINGKLPFPVDSPSTKDVEHDITVAPEYFVEHGICTPLEYRIINNISWLCYGAVSEYLRRIGLLLLDTKLEFGKRKSNGHIMISDEIFTPDSSRFWKIDERGTIQTDENDQPISFSKEFARGISKDKRQYNDDERLAIAVRYIQSYEFIARQKFVPDMRSEEEKVLRDLRKAVKEGGIRFGKKKAEKKNEKMTEITN